MSKKILVIEDDPTIQELLEHLITNAGYNARLTSTGSEGLAVWEEWEPDLVVLDLLLPDMHGYDVCRRIRQSGQYTGILMLTALDDEIDQVTGLELGADDYLPKPFRPRELMARIRSILRRVHAARPVEKLQSGSLLVDTIRGKTYWDAEEVPLTQVEMQILIRLLENANQVVSRAELAERIWGTEDIGDTRTIDVHVRHIRAKFEQVTDRTVIETVRGVGYRLAVLQ